MRKLTKSQLEAVLLKYISPTLTAVFAFGEFVTLRYLPSNIVTETVSVLSFLLTASIIGLAWLAAIHLVYRGRHTEIPFDPDTHWGAYLDPRFFRSDDLPSGQNQKPSLVCAKCVSPPDEVVVHLGNWPGGYKCMRCGTEYTKP